MQPIKFKMLMAATCLATANLAFADANVPSNDYKNEVLPVTCSQGLMLKDGFYIGANAGYDTFKIKLQPNAIVGGAGGAGLTGNLDVSSTGFVGGLYAGYGMYLNNWGYVGGEFFGSGTTANHHLGLSLGAARYDNDLQQYGNWGVSFVPGVKFSESTLVYARLGWSQARFKSTELAVFAGNVEGSTNISWRSGFNYGLGVETAVYQNISLRGEVNHTSYSNFTNGLGTKYSPYETQVMLGISYHLA